MAFDPFNKVVLSGGNDCKVISWDIWTLEKYKTYSGHKEAVTSVVVDGNFVLSGYSLFLFLQCGF